MRVLIDIGHPAHVHLFKNLAWKLQKDGHKILFTCRDREHVVHLLRTYGFVYENFGKHYKSLKGKIFGLVKNELQMLDTAIRFKPDMFISHGSTIAAHASFVVRKPHIALEDTFNMEQVRLYLPFTDAVITGKFPHVSLGKKEICIPGYKELAYLHPNVFTPDETVLDRLGVDKSEKYVIVRFVAWAATHDMGHKGLSLEDKRNLVKHLAQRMKVFITSEDILPDEFQKYRIKLNPEDIHNALAFAQLFVGESGTMATECAILGVPNIQIRHSISDNDVPGVHRDLVKRGLKILCVSDNIQRIIDQIDTIINSSSSRELFISRRDQMLRETIDLTSFLVLFTTDYPDSMQNYGRIIDSAMNTQIASGQQCYDQPVSNTRE